jgi:hypothetical protein
MILGSGWGGFKLLRDMDKDAYQIVAVSPRYNNGIVRSGTFVELYTWTPG